MAVNGFDFNVDSFGEIILDATNNDISKVSGDDLRIQLAYTRIKSCINDWFYDEVGANLEELVGRAARPSTIDVGKSRIYSVLTYDGLWDADDIFVQTKIKDSNKLIYAVYLRLYTEDEFGETSTALIIELDLIKGIKIRYGWDNDNKYILK